MIKCSECGKLVLISNINDGSTMYCKKCKHEKDLEKYSKYDKKRIR